MSLALSETPKTGFVRGPVEIQMYFTNTFKKEPTARLDNKCLKMHDHIIILLCSFTRRKRANYETCASRWLYICKAIYKGVVMKGDNTAIHVCYLIFGLV